MTEPPSDDASARTPAPPPPAPATPAHSLEPVFFMIALGLSTALSNAVGSHLGARRVTEARRASAIGVGVGLCSVVGSLGSGAYHLGIVVYGLECGRGGGRAAPRRERCWEVQLWR